jgi:hypothetical protein
MLPVIGQAFAGEARAFALLARFFQLSVKWGANEVTLVTDTTNLITRLEAPPVLERVVSAPIELPRPGT